MLLGTFRRLEPIISARIKLTGSPFSELAIALFINQSVVPFRSVRFCPKFKKEVLRPDSEALLFLFLQRDLSPVFWLPLPSCSPLGFAQKAAAACADRREAVAAKNRETFGRVDLSPLSML